MFCLLLRSYKLEYLKDSSVDDLDTYTFHMPKNMFYNASLNPDNEGFCTKNCLPNGVMNISKCYGGILFFQLYHHSQLYSYSKFSRKVFIMQKVIWISHSYTYFLDSEKIEAIVALFVFIYFAIKVTSHAEIKKLTLTPNT